MPKIVKEFFFIFIFFLNLNIYSIEFSTIVEGDGEEVNELLKKALDQSILKVLGSKRDFVLNQESFKRLDPSLYVQEYKFINVDEKEALEVTIDLKSLQEKLLELNLGITFVENPKISAWVLCKSDFSSIEAAKSLEQKCKYIKKEFKTYGISHFKKIEESKIKNISLFNDETKPFYTVDPKLEEIESEIALLKEQVIQYQSQISTPNFNTESHKNNSGLTLL